MVPQRFESSFLGKATSACLLQRLLANVAQSRPGTLATALLLSPPFGGLSLHATSPDRAPGDADGSVG